MSLQAVDLNIAFTQMSGKQAFRSSLVIWAGAALRRADVLWVFPK